MQSIDSFILSFFLGSNTPSLQVKLENELI